MQNSEIPCDCLFEDLNLSQIFSIEITIHEILIKKGPHRNVPFDESELEERDTEKSEEAEDKNEVGVEKDEDKSKPAVWELRKMNPFKVAINVLHLRQLEMYQIDKSRSEDFLTQEELERENEILRAVYPPYHLLHKKDEVGDEAFVMGEVEEKEEAPEPEPREKSQRKRGRKGTPERGGARNKSTPQSRSKSPKGRLRTPSEDLALDIICLGPPGSKQGKGRPTKKRSGKAQDPNSSEDEAKAGRHQRGGRKGHPAAGGGAGPGETKRRRANERSKKGKNESPVVELPTIQIPSSSEDENPFLETKTTEETNITREQRPAETWSSFEKGIFTVFPSTPFLVIKSLQKSSLEINLYRFAASGESVRVGKTRVHFDPSFPLAVFQMNKPTSSLIRKRVEGSYNIKDIEGVNIGEISLEFTLAGYGAARVYSKLLGVGSEGLYKFFTEPESVIPQRQIREINCRVNHGTASCARDVESKGVIAIENERKAFAPALIV